MGQGAWLFRQCRGGSFTRQGWNEAEEELEVMVRAVVEVGRVALPQDTRTG